MQYPVGIFVRDRQIACVLGAAMLGALVAPTAAMTASRAIVLEIDGAIAPAIADYVVLELGRVKPVDTGLVVLRMNTPGGLDTSMRDIIRAILASPVPVARLRMKKDAPN